MECARFYGGAQSIEWGLRSSGNFVVVDADAETRAVVSGIFRFPES